MKWYITSAKREFASVGFIGCPLTDEQLVSLYKRNVKLEEVYGIGCDVAAGFDFDFAVEANSKHATA